MGRVVLSTQTLKSTLFFCIGAVACRQEVADYFWLQEQTKVEDFAVLTKDMGWPDNWFDSWVKYGRLVHQLPPKIGQEAQATADAAAAAPVSCQFLHGEKSTFTVVAHAVCFASTDVTGSSLLEFL
jgi:hypothetical protein